VVGYDWATVSRSAGCFGCYVTCPNAVSSRVIHLVFHRHQHNCSSSLDSIKLVYQHPLERPSAATDSNAPSVSHGAECVVRSTTLDNRLNLCHDPKTIQLSNLQNLSSCFTSAHSSKCLSELRLAGTKPAVGAIRHPVVRPVTIYDKLFGGHQDRVVSKSNNTEQGFSKL
jgi:hypothetical protein